MTSNTTTHHNFTERSPRKGQRIIVTGVHIAGGVPMDEGTAAVYLGRLNGSVRLQGNTADITFADPAATWRARTS